MAKPRAMRKKLRRLDFGECQGLDPCEDCGGTGEIQSAAWASWWKEHRRDWNSEGMLRTAPPGDEFIECANCLGMGFMLNSIGREMATIVVYMAVLGRRHPHMIDDSILAMLTGDNPDAGEN